MGKLFDDLINLCPLPHLLTFLEHFYSEHFASLSLSYLPTNNGKARRRHSAQEGKGGGGRQGEGVLVHWRLKPGGEEDREGPPGRLIPSLF